MAGGDRILWVDWVGAVIVGIATLSLRDWLSAVGGLPISVLLVVGIANLLYASYSFSLCFLANRSVRLIEILVLANLGWSLICIALLIGNWPTVTGLGIVHLGGEALYVGGLALVEWRCRERLTRVRVGRSRVATRRPDSGNRPTRSAE